MASNRTTDKVTTDEAATQTEAKPFSFSRLINRNGHEKDQQVLQPDQKRQGHQQFGITGAEQAKGIERPGHAKGYQ